MTKPKGIYGFQGEYRYLSNFYIEPDGTHVEGHFQEAKCAEAYQRRWFHVEGEVFPTWKSPKECKAIGRKVVLRDDWEDVKLDIMLFHVRKKFKDHPSLAEKLRWTCLVGPYIEETNSWGDTFWGVCNGKGLNMLGEILMVVRAEAFQWPHTPDRMDTYRRHNE